MKTFFINNAFNIIQFLFMVGAIWYNIIKTQTIKTNDLYHLDLAVKTINEQNESARGERKELFNISSEIKNQLSKLEGQFAMYVALNKQKEGK